MEVRAGWAPQPGPQRLLVRCPVPDVFFGGARGGGKSDGLMGDWLFHQHRHGSDARGLLIRRTYPELEELEFRLAEIYTRAGAAWKASKRTFVFPSGAILRLRHLERDAHASRYQGHQYTWIAVDEAGAFASPVPLDKLRATLRSAAGVPPKLRLSGNPGGPGHNWLRRRYVSPAPALTPFKAEIRDETTGHVLDTTQRVFIPSRLEDNPILIKNDPGYEARILAAASGPLRDAWRWGDWDITAGGMVDDLWDRRVHVVPPFEVPRTWTIFRAMDWGESAPFSIGWWALSDGTDAKIEGRSRSFPRGTMFRLAEWYGTTGNPDEGLKMQPPEVAKGIVDRETAAPWRGRVKPGPADTQIWEGPPGDSVASKMAGAGVSWTRAWKVPGSRAAGARTIRAMLQASVKGEGPGLYVVETCRHWLELVPTIQRDEKDLDDVDENQEDHLWDETRYAVQRDSGAGGTLRLR